MSEGLRERRKMETRQEISNVATELFIEHGFEKVTIADIAAAAGVAKMTVTNHFPRKEDLALDLHEEMRTLLAEVVAGRRKGESALAALRRYYFERLAAREPLLGFSGRNFAKMITDSPTLQARHRELEWQRQEALAATLAAETGTPVTDITPRLVAAQLTAVFRLLFQDAFARTLDGESDDQIAEALAASAETAFNALEPLIGDYAIK
jgi:AcrR family transcriptional regulator